MSAFVASYELSHEVSCSLILKMLSFAQCIIEKSLSFQIRNENIFLYVTIS